MKVLVIGASLNPRRVSHRVIHLMRADNHEVFAIGRTEGIISDIKVSLEHLNLTDLDTISLYINPNIQPQYYKYILSLKPKRVIFNPGTENQEFMKLLETNGIATENSCNLVLLTTGQFN